MYIPCVVESVRVHVLTGQHVVLLQARDAERLLPIWIGADQAFSIACTVAGKPPERPLTHDLIVEMLGKLNAEITRVVVKDLIDEGNGTGVFHGSVFLQVGGRELEIDSRASDAIALAVRVDARILVAREVFDRSSIAAEGQEQEEHELSVFKEFINSLPDEPRTRLSDEPPPPRSA